MVYYACLLEMNLFVLNQYIHTFMFTPKTLNSSASTDKSWRSWPSSFKKSASSRSSNLSLSAVRGLKNWFSIQYMCLFYDYVLLGITESLRFNSKYSTTSKQEHFIGIVDEISPIPDTWAQHKGCKIEEERIPIPDKIKRIEDIIKYCHRNKRLI